MIAIAHVEPHPEDPSDAAADLRGRPAKLRELARELGIELEVWPASAWHEAPPGDASVEGALARAKAVWWLGRLTFRPESVPLVAAIRDRARRLGVAPAILDDPDAVDEAFSLARFYPLLERAGVPQALTRFLPLDAAEIALDEEPLRAHLLERIAREGIGRDPPPRFDDGPLFFRTCYGTLKIASGLNGAFSPEDLAEAGARLVVRLRVGQEIGGICVRETLAIPARWLQKGRAVVRRELRIFCVDGAPVSWSLAGSHADYATQRISPATLAEVVGMTPALEREVREVSARAARALRVRFLVVDVTVLADGRVVCLETNPGYGCGWYHPAAFLASHGTMLRRLEGRAPPTPDETRTIGARLGYPWEGEGSVFGLWEADPSTATDPGASRGPGE